MDRKQKTNELNGMSNEKRNLTEIEKNQLMQLLDTLLTLKAKGTAKKNLNLVQYVRFWEWHRCSDSETILYWGTE